MKSVAILSVKLDEVTYFLINMKRGYQMIVVPKKIEDNWK